MNFPDVPDEIEGPALIGGIAPRNSRVFDHLRNAPERTGGRDAPAGERETRTMRVLCLRSVGPR